MTTKKKRFYSVKKRLDYTKTKTCFEVMVRMPEYRPFPISVGGMDRPYLYWTYDEAKASCEQRITEEIERGNEATFENFVYEVGFYDYQIVYEDMLDPHNKLEIKFSPADNQYIWRIRFLDEQGNDYGSESNGQWHDSQASCEADARLHFLMERQSDND